MAKIDKINLNGSDYDVSDPNLVNNSAVAPNFDGMTPIETHEFDLTNTSYHPIYEIPNQNYNNLNMNIVVGYRITVTGASIGAIIDVYDRWVSPMATPIQSVSQRTLYESPATGAIRYLRSITPGSAYVGNPTYKMGMEVGARDSTTRHVKIEVFQGNNDIGWADSQESTIYVSSSAQNANTMDIETTRGWCLKGTNNATVNVATSANYVNTQENAFETGVSTIAGEAIASGDLMFLAKEGKWYKLSTTNKNMSTGFIRVARAGNTWSANGSISYRYAITASALTATQTSATPHGTLAIYDTVYLRCVRDSNGDICSDNYLSASMQPGYTWLKIGWMYNSTQMYTDTRGSQFITLDINGKITHIDGVEIA